MEATSKTDIIIFPLGETREGATIQWIMREENGDLSLPRNLCINPILTPEDQYEEAKDFVVDPYEESILKIGTTFLGKAYEG